LTKALPPKRRRMEVSVFMPKRKKMVPKAKALPVKLLGGIEGAKKEIRRIEGAKKNIKRRYSF